LIERWPEVEIARRITERHNYTPGSGLLELVQQYADVEFLPIPVHNVDGVSLHLKIKGMRPSIIVNSGIADTRQTFTLAHEFGHVLIPWHAGTIFSFTDGEIHTEGADQAYWEMEAEANRFAAELLMPQHWLHSLHLEHKNPAYTAEHVRKLCGTSMQAVVIAVNKSLPPGYVYASVDEEGAVVTSSSSRGTYAPKLKLGQILSKSSQLAECKEWFEYEFRGVKHCWLSFEAEKDLESVIDPRPWREILEEILVDTDAVSSQANIKMSLNAIVASTNNPEYSAKSFFAAVRQKLAGRGRPYEQILQHPKFNSYLIKRIEDLMGRRS
jgi:Zn-dependent peptidase ImmA (M78 family)